MECVWLFQCGFVKFVVGHIKVLTGPETIDLETFVASGQIAIFFLIFLVQKTIVDCVHKQSTGGFIGRAGDTIDLEIFFDVHEQLLRSKY